MNQVVSIIQKEVSTSALGQFFLVINIKNIMQPSHKALNASITII